MLGKCVSGSTLLSRVRFLRLKMCIYAGVGADEAAAYFVHPALCNEYSMGGFLFSFGNITELLDL
jgi:hypothetical protein